MPSAHDWQPVGMHTAAVIFDMDGVLVDSEPLWRRAEIDVFAEVGLHLTEAQCAATMGLRMDEVVDIWFAREPWNTDDPADSPASVTTRVVDRVVELVRAGAQPMPGVTAALRRCDDADLPCAIASSSPRRLIDTVVDAFGFAERFAVTCSAENETHGKPHPAVFLRTAAGLGVDARRCLVVEDSVNGVIAARAAGMRVVAVPDSAARDDPRFSIADAVLGSLADFDPTTFA